MNKATHLSSNLCTANFAESTQTEWQGRQIEAASKLWNDLAAKTAACQSKMSYLPSERKFKPDPNSCLAFVYRFLAFLFEPWDTEYAIHRFRDLHCEKSTALRSVSGIFIHANRMRAAESARTFIASQYPYGNYWDTIYAQNPSVIVDLTGTNEPKERNLQPYYPKEGEKGFYGKSFVSAQEVQGDAVSYTVTPLSKESKTMTRLAFPAWADFGVISVGQLHQLVERVEEFAPNLEKECIWIHCRGGVGRTGTLIAAMIIKERIANGSMRLENLGEQIADLVLQLRKQRNEMFVQTPEQFKLLLDYAHSLFLDR